MTTELAAVERPDKRDPEVQALVDKFEQTMKLTMPKPHLQRRAAKTLIQRHGVEAVLKVIEAAKAVQRQPYAPQILDLMDLRDKWNNLKAYYERLAGEQKPYRSTPEGL